MNAWTRAVIETLALVAVGAGVWMLSPPAALVLLGSLTLAASFVGRRGREGERHD